MTTIPHDSVSPARVPWTAALTTELWASLAIVAIWLAVLFAAIYGGEFVSTTPGGNSTTFPSGVLVALFATIATWPVAKYGYRRDRSS
jgi:uncharacterized RDD family membrane protein YckC